MAAGTRADRAHRRGHFRAPGRAGSHRAGGGPGRGADPDPPPRDAAGDRGGGHLRARSGHRPAPRRPDADADQAAVALTRYPPALASALEKLEAKGAAVRGPAGHAGPPVAGRPPPRGRARPGPPDHSRTGRGAAGTVTRSVTAGVPRLPIPYPGWPGGRELAACVAGGGLRCRRAGAAAPPQPPAAAPTTFAPTRATTPPAPTTTRPPPPLAPLTGLPQPHPSQLHAPAVVVKIDNVDAARPQTGVNQADVVYEELVEGGLTRLAAVFQSQYPAVVGPGSLGPAHRRGRSPTTSTIRSSPIRAPTPGFCPSSASQPVTDVDDGNRPDLFWRSNLAAAPDNLYANVVVPGRGFHHARPARSPSALPGGRRHLRRTGGGPGRAHQHRLRGHVGDVGLERLLGRPGCGARTARRTSTGPGCSSAPPMSSSSSSRTSPRGWRPERALPPAPIPTGQLVGRGTAWYLSAGRMVKGTWYRAALTASDPVCRTPAGRRSASRRAGPGWSWSPWGPCPPPLPSAARAPGGRRRATATDQAAHRADPGATWA